MNPLEVRELLPYLTDAEKTELATLLMADPTIWRPLPGPQHLAYESKATIVGFGGAAGGGKTDLACGKALTRHERSMILRRIGTELTAILDRITGMLGTRDGYNGRDNIWRVQNRQVEFGAVPTPGDERKYQGRPHDFLVFDEATNFLESQVRFLLGWLRTTTPGQACQALLTFNPPTTAEGRWIVAFFAPWLDDKYPNPAAPGELRYCAMIPAREGLVSADLWVDKPDPFILIDGAPDYDFAPELFDPTDIITPQSRTFIPSRITDNPFLLGTGYLTQLQAMPEPLRSQMLKGDFKAGMVDDPYQLIPTTWVDEAMARWERPRQLPEMLAMGVDVARGGKDNTVIMARHKGWWFDEPIVTPGKQTPNGPTVAGLVVAAHREDAPIHVDVIGVGASVYDHLAPKYQTLGVNVAEKATALDRSGRLSFFNLRSQLCWQFRELLDPANGYGVALPPNLQLRADLCAFTWELRGMALYVSSRDEIIERIGRSPDYASACFLAAIDTPKLATVRELQRKHDRNYDPLAPGGALRAQGGDYDPFAMQR